MFFDSQRISWCVRSLAPVAALLLVCGLCPADSRKLVFFHNSIPSNLYVSAAHGPTHIKDDPDGKTEIIRLLLYPSDKKSRAPKTGRAVVNSGSVYGLVTFRQDNPPTGPTFIAGVMKDLPPGMHGLKIFQYGDIESNCSATGSVYSPYNLGLDPSSPYRDLGDLGFIMADGSGTAEFAMSNSQISLVGPRSIMGRAIVVTEMNEDSGSNEVKRRGCGVIGYAR